VPDDIASNVYRIAQECLTNAIRHGAPSEVRLCVGRIAERAGAIALTVEDDGGGDAARVVAAAGRGITGMRERVEAFGGDFMICRAARGVRVAATIPLAAA
jgi:two-component system, NarL family, sensor histidine kinase UhpB